LTEVIDGKTNQKFYCKGYRTAREYFKAYREKNREKLRIKKKEYYQRHKERVKEYHRRHYLQHRERTLARNLEYRQRPEAKERIRKWRREYQKEYKQRPEVKQMAREYSRKYYERRQDRILMRRIQIKTKLVAKKGGKCEICGYSKCLPALEFHHITPVASARKRRGSELPQSRKFDLSKVMLVCSNCHIEIHSIDQTKAVPGAFYGQKS